MLKRDDNPYLLWINALSFWLESRWCMLGRRLNWIVPVTLLSFTTVLWKRTLISIWFQWWVFKPSKLWYIVYVHEWESKHFTEKKMLTSWCTAGGMGYGMPWLGLWELKAWVLLRQSCIQGLNSTQVCISQRPMGSAGTVVVCFMLFIHAFPHVWGFKQTKE